MRTRNLLRVIVSVALLVAVPASLIYQLNVRPPDDTFSDAPEGWSTSYTSDDLTGLLAAFNSATTPVQPNTTDYARVLAYATDAYWLTAYRDETPDQASSAFLSVVTTMVPDPEFAALLPTWDRSRTGAAGEVLLRASRDGYDAGQPDPMLLNSPIDLGVEAPSYSWRVSAGFGNEMERGWGTLTPVSGAFCDVPAPPIRTLDDLRTAANEVAALIDELMNREDVDRIRSLLEAWTYPVHAQPARTWLQITTNVAVDAGLDRRSADTLIRDMAVAVHDTQISAFAAKYRYVLASPQTMADNFRPFQAPYAPSYPSEYAAVASVAAALIDRHAPSVRIRLEIPGSFISAPTTRVFSGVHDAQLEAENAAVLSGLDYRFSVDAGRELGRCIALGVSVDD